MILFYQNLVHTLDVTPNGRYMAVVGCHGHLAIVDMKTLNLIKKIQVRETACDVVYLHNKLFCLAANFCKDHY